MKREYDIHQLAELKSRFTAWAHDTCGCRDFDDEFWECYDDAYIHPDGHKCMCYGHEHYDDVFTAIINDEAIVIHYNDRTLTMNFDDPANPFITCGALEWVGDDEDYYGDIISFLAHINNIDY